MRVRARIFGAGMALAITAACNTPSVPLPPPVIEALAFQSGAPTGNLIVLEGKPTTLHANARFYVYDRSQGDGVITTARADGAFTTSPFTGADGDTVQIYYDSPEGERSQELCVELRLNVGLISTRCQ